MKKEILLDDLKNMKLHETLELNRTTKIMRVYGGWIYYHFDLINTNWLKQTTFVPRTD